MRVKNRLPDSYRLLFGTENSMIWLVAIVGLGLSLAALLLIQQQLEAHKMLDFEWVAHNRTRALEHGIDNSILAVETIRDHISASGAFDATSFNEFSESLLERYKGIQALLWVPLIQQKQRAVFEVSTAKITESSTQSDLTTRVEQPEYFPVTHASFNADSDIPLGYDLGSIPIFRETLLRARDERRISASGRMVFPLEQDNTEFGFMVASPVFRSIASTNIANQDENDLLGFAVGFFHLSNLAGAAISLLEPRGVELLILDESAPADQRFLHFYASRLAPSEVSEENYKDWWSDKEEPKVVEHIQVADRQLTIVCGRTDMFRSAEAFREGPWVAMIAGLLFTVLLSFYLARIRENNRQRSIMEQQLVEREELFRQMTETVDETFWATTVDGEKLLYLSPNYKKTLGLTGGDEEKFSIMDRVYVDDRKLLTDALHRIGRDGNDMELTHRVRRADGTLRWVRTRGFPVRDDEYRINRLVGFSEDITERKLADEALRDSEAKLRDLFQQSPDIIMTVDRSGKILLMNRSTSALPADLAVGRNSLALMPAKLREWFRRALKKVFKKGVIRQFQYSTDDGAYWEGRIVPIRDEGGPVTAAMVIASEVTEKRDLEIQALRNARLASIGVLAAGVAHEINNPNNAIQFNASLVSRAWEDITPILKEFYAENGDFAVAGLPYSEARENYTKMLAEISRNSERIRRIVQNLKHMSRHDAGELAEDVDIQQVLEATTMILHNQIQKYTDVYHIKVDSDLPRVKGNSQQLEQVFINILLNALQAVTQRTEEVRIHADYNRDDDVINIEVRDEGRGISERNLGRLTEPFFTTRTDAGGTGLGLSITRSIVEKHGGSMEFESAVGRGTRVTIRLPGIHRA